MLFKQVNWDVSKIPPHSVFIFSVDSKHCLKYYPLFVAPNHIQRTIIPRPYLGIVLGRGGGYLFHKGANLKVFLSISEILREESNIKSGGKSLRACLQRSWQGWRSNFLSGSGAPGISKSIFSRNFYLRREKSRPSNNLSACNPHIKSPQKDVQGDWNRILWYPILSLSTRYVYLGGGRQICN